MQNFLILVFLFIVFSVPFKDLSGASNTNSDSLNLIPANEKYYIKLLFDFLFRREPFGYTLYFDKPMSFSDSILNFYSLDAQLEQMRIDQCVEDIFSCYPPGQVFSKGWNLWTKYAPQFTTQNFYLFKRKWRGADAIFLINKKAFRTAFSNHEILFRKIMGENITVEHLFNEMEKGDSDIFEVLSASELLAGILLGFGEHNSRLFLERELVEKKVHACHFWSLSSSLQKKLDQLWDILQIVDNPDTVLISLNNVFFASDVHHLETLELQKRYRSQSIQLKNICLSDNWFEEILTQLCNN